MITHDDVKKLANLARLELTDEELERFATELSNILGYIEQLQEVDVQDVEPTSQVTGLQNVLREDVLNDELRITNEELAKIAPKFRDGYVVVPAVLDRSNHESRITNYGDRQ